MLKCLAIDDEPLALELLEDNISQVPYLKLVAACSNPIEAMKILQHEEIDLIFKFLNRISQNISNINIPLFIYCQIMIP